MLERVWNYWLLLGRTKTINALYDRFAHKRKTSGLDPTTKDIKLLTF
jgi:hypothetical protein